MAKQQAKPKVEEKQAKIRLIFEDLAGDDDLDHFNTGYKTVVVTLPKGFDPDGFRLAGIEWEVGE